MAGEIISECRATSNRNGGRLHRRGVEARSAVDAQIRRRLVTGMDISADEAKLGSNDPCLHAAGRHDASHDAMLTALEIDDISGSEFGQSQKTRPVDRVRLRS